MRIKYPHEHRKFKYNDIRGIAVAVGINTGYSLIAPGSCFCRRHGNTERKSQKRVQEGENYRSLRHCLLMSWKPADHIALAWKVESTQTWRRGISSMWKVTSESLKKAKRKQTNPKEKRKNDRRERQTGFHRASRKGGRLNESREGDFPEDDVVFECLKRAVAPTADQRQRSGSALGGIKSR